MTNHWKNQKKTRKNRKSPGQICVSPAEKTANNTLKSATRLRKSYVHDGRAISESFQACFVLASFFPPVWPITLSGSVLT